MIVADANLLIHLLSREPESQQARAVFVADGEWAAPLLWRSEFRNAMATAVRLRSITIGDALERVRRAHAVLLGREFDVISDRVLSLAAESGCSAYDCEYIDVAQRLAVPLVTSDRKLIRAFPRVAVSPQHFLDS